MSSRRDSGGAFHGKHIPLSYPSGYDCLEIVNTEGSIVGRCETVVPPVTCRFSNGLLCLCHRDSRKVGYIDVRGDWIIPPIFQRAEAFHNQVAIAYGPSRGEGIIDRTGSWKCDPVYHQIFDFDEETSSTIAYVHVAHVPGVRGRLRCVLVDEEGNQVGDECYDHGHRGGQGLVPVARGTQWSVVTHAGELVIPFAFHGIDPFSEGVAVTRGADGRVGAIGKRGRWVIKPTFTSMNRFSEGLCAAAVEDDSGRLKWGYIDGDGNWVIEPAFGEAWELRNGVALVSIHAVNEDEDEFGGYIDRSGEFIWGPA